MMLALRLSAAALPVMLLVSSASLAQLNPGMQTGSLVPVKPHTIDPIRAGLVKQDFARCVYSRNKPAVDRMLLASDLVTFDGMDGKPVVPYQDRLQMAECLGRQTDQLTAQIGMRLPSDSMRSLLTQAAYVANVTRLPSNDGSVNAERRFASTDEKLARARGLAELADCVVAHDVLTADALVRVAPGNPAELEVARKLGPAFGACMTSGQSFHLNAAFMRTIAADGLWQRYVAGRTDTSRLVAGSQH
jgi:hypothetical protein